MQLNYPPEACSKGKNLPHSLPLRPHQPFDSIPKPPSPPSHPKQSHPLLCPTSIIYVVNKLKPLTASNSSSCSFKRSSFFLPVHHIAQEGTQQHGAAALSTCDISPQQYHQENKVSYAAALIHNNGN